MIDRLAREGMVLDAAYHMGSFSGAVCTPSRHMVMCGRSVWHLPIGPRTTGHEQGRKAARTDCPPDTRDDAPELLARYGATNHADPFRFSDQSPPSLTARGAGRV